MLWIEHIIWYCSNLNRTTQDVGNINNFMCMNVNHGLWLNLLNLLNWKIDYEKNKAFK